MKLVKPNKRRKPPKEKVVFFNGVTRCDLPADQILREAIGCMDGVIIAGLDKDGNYYFASSYADGAKAVWLAEQFKRRLFSDN